MTRHLLCEHFTYKRLPGPHEIPEFVGDEESQLALVGAVVLQVPGDGGLLLHHGRRLGDDEGVTDADGRLLEQAVHVGDQLEHEAGGRVPLAALCVELGHERLLVGGGEYLLVDLVVEGAALGRGGGPVAATGQQQQQRRGVSCQHHDAGVARAAVRVTVEPL